MTGVLRRRPALTALIAGAMSAFAFAPLSLWPVGLLALAVLLQLIARSASQRAAFALGYAFGVGHFVLGLNWIAHAFTFQDAMPHWFGYGAVLLLSLYLAVYPALATAIAWRLGNQRMVPTIFAFAGAWMLTEMLRASLFTGFAWNPLGVLWLGTGIDQTARIIGTYGLGGLAVLAGGAIWLASLRVWRAAGLIAAPLAIMAGLGLLSSTFVQTPTTRQTAIRVVQPNINQNEKHDPALELVNFRRLANLSGTPSPAARLVFWPEAAVPAILDMEPEWRVRIAALLGPNDLLLLGGTKLEFKPGAPELMVSEALAGARNSLWTLTPDARLIGRYDKAHLVPYGEYLPMRPILSAIGLSRLVPGDIDFWPGPGPRTLDLPAAGDRPALRMGVQICYEMIFSGAVVDAANRPDFIFNPSNDAWFGAWGPPQHLAQAQLRAIEEALPVIRSTPTGISALVDARGTVIASIPHGAAGGFDALLGSAGSTTLFARLGNLLPLSLAITFILTCVAFRRRSG